MAAFRLLMKSRKEQKAEIKEFVQPYANPNCKDCLGRGRSDWIEYLGDMRLRQYKICDCALRNIRIEKAESVN